MQIIKLLLANIKYVSRERCGVVSAAPVETSVLNTHALVKEFENKEGG